MRAYGWIAAGAGVLLSGLALSAQAQGSVFDAMLNEAKRQAEARARDAMNRAATAPPAATPGASAQPASPQVPAGWPAGFPTPSTPPPAAQPVPQGWPAGFPAPSTPPPTAATSAAYVHPVDPYVPPGPEATAPIVLPKGTPDSTTIKPPRDANGRPAWIYSEYELKPLSWGNELPVRGSAGAPEYLKANINNSPTRQKWISTFDSWIRATYRPMGATTAAFREIYPDKATQDHVPVIYGVSETLYDPVAKGGKIYRSPGPPFGYLTIMANQIPGHTGSWPFSNANSYVFTMAFDRDYRPTEQENAAKVAAEQAAIARRINTPGTRVYLTTQTVVVMITRDNRLPARQMSIAETLAAADPGIRAQQIKEQSPQELYQRRLAGVQTMRARHALELNAPAFVQNMQFLHYNFDSKSDFDVYGRTNRGETYPVYTFDPPVYDAARTDTPQWLAITFPRLNANGNNRWNERQAFNIMVDHFNFAYARDAIFEPEKVRGVAYRPRP